MPLFYSPNLNNKLKKKFLFCLGYYAYFSHISTDINNEVLILDSQKKNFKKASPYICTGTNMIEIKCKCKCSFRQIYISNLLFKIG